MKKNKENNAGHIFDFSESASIVVFSEQRIKGFFSPVTIKSKQGISIAAIELNKTLIVSKECARDILLKQDCELSIITDIHNF